jgi:hypothetical protein
MVDVCPVRIDVGLAVMVSIIQGSMDAPMISFPLVLGVLVPHQFSVAFIVPSASL